VSNPNTACAMRINNKNAVQHSVYVSNNSRSHSVTKRKRECQTGLLNHMLSLSRWGDVVASHDYKKTISRE
jgi:hypothetical protein